MFSEGHHILSGKINSGKSLRLWKLYESMHKTKKIAGWVSLPYFDGGKKVGYDIAFIVNSIPAEKIPLARTRRFEKSFKWRRFWFNGEAFDKAQEMSFGSPDVFLIDEVGPLELSDHKGFWPAVKDIYRTQKTTITVVRDECLKEFTKAFGLVLTNENGDSQCPVRKFDQLFIQRLDVTVI